MKTLAGLWIDHREAVIVILSDKGEEARRVNPMWKSNSGAPAVRPPRLLLRRR